MFDVKCGSDSVYAVMWDVVMVAAPPLARANVGQAITFGGLSF